MYLWPAFITCTLLIVFSGSRLSRFGDIIAEKTGLGRTWIGLVLIASVTSLPELMTGISAVTFSKTPDIATGSVIGSCAFNMLILALLDAVYRPMPLSAKAHQGHILSAGFGILLLTIVSGSLFLGKAVSPVGWIGPYSLIIIVFYFILMRLVFHYEKRKISAFVKESAAAQLKYKDISTRTAVIGYSVNAVVIIAAAFFLPKIGQGIAVTTGLGETFVGNIFIAFATSLPEVVVSLFALKIDAVDLAIGNLFGSNLFNIFILTINDIFFLKGPILSYSSVTHIIPALSAIAMTAIAIIGLTYRASRKPLFLAWDSIGMLMTYIVSMLLLYTLR